MKAPPPSGVEGAAGVIIGSNLYLTHGYIPGDSTVTRIYSLTTNTWTSGASASVARSELVGACAIDGGSAKVFAIGGRGIPGVLSTVEMYDPGANVWSARASMPTARAGLGAATDPSTNTIYVVGGRTGTAPHSGTPLAVNEAYDPGTNTWSTKAAMPVAMGDVYSTVYLSGKIYVIGGYDGTNLSGLVQIYDLATNSWSLGASMPTPRSNLIAGVCGSAIYAIGGYTGSGNLATNEAYDPVANVWTPGQASKPTAASEMAAAAISTGQEIFAVGSGAFGISSALNEMFTCAGTPTTPLPTSTPTVTPTPTPTPTPCPTAKVPVFGGCGTPTPTRTPTPTPCPSGKVAGPGGCGTPTPLPIGCEEPPWDWDLLSCFSMENLWHHETNAAVTGMSGGMLAFNQGCTGPGVGGCTFDTGIPVGGRAASPSFSAPAGAILTFQTARSTENACGSFDRTLVSYSTDGGANYLPLDLSTGSISPGGQHFFSVSEICGESLTAQTVMVPLPPGTTNIAFDFSSGDAILNNFAGQFIDNVDVVPCPPAGCPTPTATPTVTATPTPTACPTGKVPAFGGCGTPTSTPTPCPTGKVPAFSGCGTPSPNPGILPGLDFSIGVGTQCDSTAGPTKCSFPTGGTFTVSFNLNAIPAGFSYDGYDAVMHFSGVSVNPSSLTQQGAGTWPSCSFAAHSFDTPGEALFGCALGIGAQPSTYTGPMASVDFQCPSIAGQASIALIGFRVAEAHTDVIDDNLFIYSEALDESLTVNCVAPPTPTATPTPPSAVGGISIDAGAPQTSSGTNSGELAGILAAAAAAAIVLGGSAWYARRSVH